MSCNCKRKIELEEKYGTPQEETILETCVRYIGKVLLFLLLVLIAMVLTPIIIGTFVYKASFGKDMSIPLPEFMAKYMR